MDHEFIWLEPKCCASGEGGSRVWCEDNVFECDDDVPATRYVRADILETYKRLNDDLQSRLDERAKYEDALISSNRLLAEERDAALGRLGSAQNALRRLFHSTARPGLADHEPGCCCVMHEALAAMGGSVGIDSRFPSAAAPDSPFVVERQSTK